RDQYGFKRPIQWVSPKQLYEFDIKYKPMLLKQAKHWNKLFANNDQQWPTLCPELTRYVRKGIPQSFRTKAWMHYSGADNRMKANTGVYTSLIAQDCENAQTIERDLHGSFPGNSFFPQDSETNKLKMLQRILCAFSLYVPEIGYRQSLIFIAGFLLVFQDEEEAFWLLVTAIKDFFPKDMFSSSSSEQTILMMMVYEKMPGVWSKIANKKCFWECQQTDSLPSVTLVTDHWFSTMFVNVLPVETVMRIWDCFFV
ncbi:rab-GTPase-TBC domain-containing protein, partial [Mucor mucedo]|uniref:rab-GTPase-TBC domain-containing protein n=1 Tax=Mucor mucedo TaxID=29922 RepID=UPI00221FE333